MRALWRMHKNHELAHRYDIALTIGVLLGVLLYGVLPVVVNAL